MLLFKYKINSIQYLQTKHCLHGDEEGWYIKCLKKYLQHKPSWDKYMYQAHIQCSLLYHAVKLVSVKMTVSVATTTTENQLPP